MFLDVLLNANPPMVEKEQKQNKLQCFYWYPFNSIKIHAKCIFFGGGGGCVFWLTARKILFTPNLLSANLVQKSAN